MKNIININVLASIMKGLGADDYDIARAMEFSTIEELMASESNLLGPQKAVAKLIIDDLLSDDVFNLIRDIIEGRYSFDTSLHDVKKDKNGNAYLVFYLDFDEHYDYLYVDMQTTEVIGTQSEFIEYLLNR